MDQACRRNKKAFLKNWVEYSQPPLMLYGVDVWKQVDCFPRVTKDNFPVMVVV